MAIPIWFRRFRMRRNVEEAVSRPMTKEERERFDRAFEQMDIVFKNMDAVFKEMRKLRP